MRARVANLQLQKDATELSDLCASVPHDMDGVKQGLMAGSGGQIEAFGEAFETSSRTAGAVNINPLKLVCQIEFLSSDSDVETLPQDCRSEVR
jgi:hypothetical protein